MGRHYYKNCEIVGSIDFIFGDAHSLYKDCTLSVNAATYGSSTAQKRESSSKSTVFSFVGCNLLGSGQVYLGRAWGPYSLVVFAFTFMQDIVIRESWHNWNVPDRQRCFSFRLGALAEFYFNFLRTNFGARERMEEQSEFAFSYTSGTQLSPSMKESDTKGAASASGCPSPSTRGCPPRLPCR